ncbi:MAG: transcriptional repressor LexA [Gammaproteobacteria bacterium]|nr:transcriptional repressor LexA [Gammaproteobacteria bacterium]NIR28454.1 transcriptional repressor LexA [Gammaproteobacteria bacterium]NIR96900.1 transcriptional repressor LexA [Gammaproteobacteria bacterium]NIT62601.1 transcriptional repressor LexA [Gammaproteobacteria bacterium]NIV19558.1 transcriptional repressor LexA [Gammaproteobacteria bacterium]
MSDQALTRRQQAIYTFLREYHRHHEQPPSLEEICEVLGLRSRGSLHKHIQALVAAGLVEPMNGKHRGVRLSGGLEPEGHQLPLLGYIAAGRPIEAIETPETIDVPQVLRSEGSCYVLQVRGESMIEEGILDGDWVVIESREHARNGEIVVALIDNQEATLKRIQQRPGQVILHPANSTMEPMVYAPERVQIQGVVVGQMRRY